MQSKIVQTAVDRSGFYHEDFFQSPGLRLRSGLPDNYAQAVRRANAETGLTSARFPGECPYTMQQILDPEFLP
jgi:hypothetical protein